MFSILLLWYYTRFLWLSIEDSALAIDIDNLLNYINKLLLNKIALNKALKYMGILKGFLIEDYLC